ncbi:hypothetical protein PHISCL_11250, partial [Aspergillus sclerotialis]
RQRRPRQMVSNLALLLRAAMKTPRTRTKAARKIRAAMNLTSPREVTKKKRLLNLPNERPKMSRRPPQRRQGLR